MALNFADRHVVVAMFPQLKAEWAVVQDLGGLAAGPVPAGWLSDRFGRTVALAVMPLLGVGAAGLFWYGPRFYQRDRDAVRAGAGPSAARPEPQVGQP